MANYLYNYQKLPPLPEWDKEKYPYAIIGTDWLLEVLIFSSVPLSYIDYATDTEYPRYRLHATDNGSMIAYTLPWLESKWQRYETADKSFSASEVVYEPSARGDRIYWANYDVQSYADGSIYLYASYPTDAETGEEIHDYGIFHRAFSWKKHDGYAIKGNADTYKYNGVELPKLPEWDKEKYPYAFIYEGANNYQLRAYSRNDQYTDLSWNSGFGTYTYFGAMTPNSYDGIGFSTTPSGNAEQWEGGSPAYGRVLCSAILWANFDVKKSASELHLPASEPVPVGGKTEWQRGRFYKVIGGKWVKQDAVGTVAESE